MHTHTHTYTYTYTYLGVHVYIYSYMDSMYTDTSKCTFVCANIRTRIFFQKQCQKRRLEQKPLQNCKAGDPKK